ncbi:MAG: hypothetical protein M3020_25750, partial [Myxococcota bacterium]|nr:hypothetical protein [Myxococcota bacterium]
MSEFPSPLPWLERSGKVPPLDRAPPPPPVPGEACGCGKTSGSCSTPRAVDASAPALERRAEATKPPPAAAAPKKPLK